MPEKSVTSYEEAVEYILGIPKFAGKSTMEDTKAFLALMGNPDKKGRIVHVAGTNGKGSVCAYLAGALTCAGKKVCLFTSPHLTDIRERFLINGEMISEEDFLRAFLDVQTLLSQKNIRKDYHPSFFEYLFFMAMRLFSETDTDFWILETGLGGRLDATNSVGRKELAVITHMGIDHTECLGSTIREITLEKAGILQNAKEGLFWKTDDEVADVLTTEAKKRQIPYFFVSNHDYEFLNFKNKSIDFSYHSLYYGNVRLHIPTPASYQMQNVTLAFRAAEQLLSAGNADKEILQLAAKKTHWAGRMEEILPNVFLDGAHNEDGIGAFLDAVSRDGFLGKRHLYFGVVSDKAYEDMIERIVKSNLFEEISLIEMRNYRALGADKMREIFAHYTDKNIQTFSSAKEAVCDIQNKNTDLCRIYVAGSLYLVGEIKESL